MREAPAGTAADQDREDPINRIVSHALSIGSLAGALLQSGKQWISIVRVAVVA
jgi:hypothetical protein